MATPSKKRRIIPLEEKKKVIDASATKNPKKSLKDLSEQFGMPRSTVKNILDNKDSILSAIDEGGSAKRAHLKAAKYADLEELVLEEKAQDFKMDLFKALQFLRRSWNDVKPETLANCFRKAGFLKNVEPVEPSLEEQIAELLDEEEQPAEGDDELNTLWAGLQALELVEGTLDEYLAVDDQLATGGTRTLAEIAADVLTANVEEPEVDSDTDVMEIDKEPEQPPVTSREATAGFEVFQRYMEENFKDPALLQMCDKFDDLLAKERSRKMKQRNLFDYFVANY